MSTAVLRRFESRERDDDLRSEASTITGSSFPKSIISDSDRTLRHVNSATYVRSQIYESESFASDDSASEGSYHQDEIDLAEEAAPKVTKVKKIDLSPENIKRREEVFNKWVTDIMKRERENRRLARLRLENEIEARKALEEERKAKSLQKTQEWMKRKKAEAEKKVAQLKELKKANRALEKPKPRKVTLSYDEWLVKKEQDLLAAKKQEEQKKKLLKSHTDGRNSSYSFEKWSRNHSKTPKPVPMGQSLLSLKGSTTKIYVNPIPWKDD